MDFTTVTRACSLTDHSCEKVVEIIIIIKRFENANVQCILIPIHTPTPNLTFDYLCCSTYTTIPTQSNPPNSLPIVSSIRPQPDNSVPLHSFPYFFKEIFGYLLVR